MPICLGGTVEDEAPPTSNKKTKVEGGPAPVPGPEHVWLSDLLLSHKELLEENGRLKAQLMADTHYSEGLEAHTKKLDAAVKRAEAAEKGAKAASVKAKAAQKSQAANLEAACTKAAPLSVMTLRATLGAVAKARAGRYPPVLPPVNAPPGLPRPWAALPRS